MFMYDSKNHPRQGFHMTIQSTTDTNNIMSIKFARIRDRILIGKGFEPIGFLSKVNAPPLTKENIDFSIIKDIIINDWASNLERRREKLQNYEKIS